MFCFFCKKEVVVSDRVGFRESCSHCGKDLHICPNCSFYDKGAYNECGETSADRVTNKEKFNFCEYFNPAVGKAGEVVLDPVAEAKKKLEALFKK